MNPKLLLQQFQDIGPFALDAVDQTWLRIDRHKRLVELWIKTFNRHQLDRFHMISYYIEPLPSVDVRHSAHDFAEKFQVDVVVPAWSWRSATVRPVTRLKRCESCEGQQLKRQETTRNNDRCVEQLN